MPPLPPEVRRGEGKSNEAGKREAARPQQGARGRQQQRPEQRGKKENDGDFILDAQAGACSQQQPPAESRRSTHEPGYGKQGGAPKHRLGGVHGKEALRCQKNRNRQYCQHGQSRGPARTAERSRQRARKRHGKRAGEGRQEPEKNKVVKAENRLGKPRLQGHKRRLVHIAEG